ncbi:MAG: twin-arginine translocase subunit TatB [Rhodospirillaceae bacterium]|nr:twin-arginine translocase subunit TatB [Rhodospirillaceae bacterium]|tara:strand:+ start:1402 stop:1857 length:456 start_codon:yes stop_codon:yes gene_type:complete
MFDIGGWEFLLIAILGIIVIGPKELPGAIRTVMSFVRRAKELAREFQSGLEEVARETELDKVGEDIRNIADPRAATEGIRKEIEDSLDPDGDMRDAMKFHSGWSDDDLLDYDSPVFDDENKISGRSREEAAETDDPENTEPESPPTRGRSR